MLLAFDAVRAEHEGVDAERFNADDIYKRYINQVMGLAGLRQWHTCATPPVRGPARAVQLKGG